MPELIAIANKLAVSFVKSRNKKNAAKHIVHEINSLVYEESKQPADYKIKAEIIKLMQEFISFKRPYLLHNGEIIIIELKENTICLEMMDYILKRITAIHKQQATGN